MVTTMPRPTIKDRPYTGPPNGGHPNPDAWVDDIGLRRLRAPEFPEIQAALTAALATGMTVAEFCQRIGMHKTALYQAGYDTRTGRPPKCCCHYPPAGASTTGEPLARCVDCEAHPTRSRARNPYRCPTHNTPTAEKAATA